MKTVFDDPFIYPGRNAFDFFAEGNSPTILKELTDHINANVGKIKKIRFALYLYNNMVLHNALESAALKGVEVEVFSIPLEGYDADKPKNIISVTTGAVVLRNVTKYDLAKQVYDKIATNPSPKFTLNIFPHMYVRSPKVNPFSRGNMPYSLHIKSMLIENEDNSCDLVVTSSNLAVRDLCKFECMVIYRASTQEAASAITFFENLKAVSFPIGTFNPSANYYEYTIPSKTISQCYTNIYTAPFIIDSNQEAEQLLSTLVRKAQHRILICAQHVSAYKYDYQASFTDKGGAGRIIKDGFLADVINASNRVQDIRILSQTYVDQNGSSIINGVECRRPANTSNFSKFIRDYKNSNAGSYRVNEGIHEKYIIIDDHLVITTDNFTPTQFIYLPKVDIEKFDKMPNLKYKGIHSEIGQFATIKDPIAVADFEKRFNSVWNRKKTMEAYKKQ